MGFSSHSIATITIESKAPTSVIILITAGPYCVRSAHVQEMVARAERRVVRHVYTHTEASASGNVYVKRTSTLALTY